MRITKAEWNNYKDTMSLLSDTASKEFSDWANQNGGWENLDRQLMAEAAYNIASKYSEGSSALAAEMYDSIARAEKVNVPPAEMVADVNFGELAKAINGALKHSTDDDFISSPVGRSVKQAGADTMLKNASRDHAEFAWIPSGDSCAFCLVLASNGWQRASKKTINGDHASHIHTHCDCQFAIRFNRNTRVDGYNPDEYLEMYKNAEGDTSEQKIKSMRRAIEENKKILPNKKEYVFEEPNANIKKFEKKAENLQKEQAIYTRPDGSIFAEAKGGARGVRIDHPSVPGYTFSHNHPAEANFSVADVSNFESFGLKQLRAVSPKITYILESENPIQLKEVEDRRFSIAMNNKWKELDEESAKRRKEINSTAMQMPQGSKERTDFVQKEYQKLVEWRNKSESDWFKENAKKYGYHYKEIIR